MVPLNSVGTKETTQRIFNNLIEIPGLKVNMVPLLRIKEVSHEITLQPHDYCLVLAPRNMRKGHAPFCGDSRRSGAYLTSIFVVH